MSSANSGYALAGLQVDREPRGAHRVGSVGRAEHEVDLAGEGRGRRPASSARTRSSLIGAQLAAQLLQRWERCPGTASTRRVDLHQDLVLIGAVRARASTRRSAPPARPPARTATAATSRARRGGRGADLDLDRLVQQHAGGADFDECTNGGASPGSSARNEPSHRSWSVRCSLPSHSGSRSSSPRTASSIRSRSRCGRSAGNDGPRLGPDQLVERATLRIGELHGSMLESEPTWPRPPTTSCARWPTPSGSRSRARWPAAIGRPPTSRPTWACRSSASAST